MKSSWAIVLLIVSALEMMALAMTGCTPAQRPQPSPPTPQSGSADQTTSPGGSSGAMANSTAGPAVSSTGFPVIPEGAAYTLYCLTITTPTHIPDSEHVKEQLIRKTGMKDWYVLHGEGQSILYYGFYKTYTDDSEPMEKSRAQGDRKMIAQIQDDNGDHPFAACLFQPLSGPDPAAPPEWDLRHAKGFWSLHIASYTGSPQRKQYAVDAVRAARARGIEAYYYHGPSVSDVLVGCWPREAVKEQDKSVAQSDDPNKTIVVLNRPLPPGYKTDNLFTKDGHPAKVFVPKIEVQDPTLLQAMKDYPANAVNGQVYMHKMQSDHGIVEQPDPSFLVPVPQDDQSADAAPANGG